MRDLYQILNVHKTVSPTALKKAFRKASLRTHPDRGGDQAAFEEVKLAYQVLSDPAKRAHYDATGDYSAEKPENPYTASMSILAHVLIGTINDLGKQQIEPSDVDLAAHMRTALKRIIASLEAQCQQHAAGKERLAKIVGRFATEVGDNLMDGAVRAKMEQTANTLEGMLLAVTQHKEAAELLSRFRFRFDAPREEAWGTPMSSMFFRWETLSTRDTKKLAGE